MANFPDQSFLKSIKFLPGALISSAYLLLVVNGSVLAQSIVPNDSLQQTEVTELSTIVTTEPADDTVLAFAPEQLSLQFVNAVRLVKLTLHNQDRDWVDISFRYSPRLATEFQWGLPLLEAATYYTVDWAVLDSNEGLLRGKFNFAFGPGAERPSVSQEAAAMTMELHHQRGAGRNIMPFPAEIIINDDDSQRSYDPPFTIDLELPPQ